MGHQVLSILKHSSKKVKRGSNQSNSEMSDSAENLVQDSCCRVIVNVKCYLRHCKKQVLARYLGNIRKHTTDSPIESLLCMLASSSTLLWPINANLSFWNNHHCHG